MNEPIPFEPPSRQLPYSEEAEKHVLAVCMVDGDNRNEKGEFSWPTLNRCLNSGVTPDSFYLPANRLIFTTLCELQRAKKATTSDILAEVLTNTQHLADVGGPAYLMAVISGIETTAHAGHMIARVREKQLLRETILAATRTVEEAYSFAANGEGLEEFLDLARKRLPEPAAAHGPNGAYTVWSPAQFRAYQPPVDMNLVGGGYIRRRQLTTLIGPPGVGKSRVSLWLACLHITGREFFGLECKGEAKWLFFGNENDPIRQKSDLEWFYRNMTEDEQKKVDQNLRLHAIQEADDGIITLADPEAFTKLVKTLKKESPDVVVFDPWANMIEGNENDNEEVRRTLRLLMRAINENCPDAAILVIHHARTGKATAIEAGNNYSGGSLGRGSKALVSAARCELALWPGDSDDSSKLVFTCEKANNVQKFEPKGLLFENGIYREDATFDLKAWRDDIEGKRSNKTLTIADVVQMVKDGLFRSGDIVSRCEEEFGVSRRTVHDRLKDAVDKEYLVKGSAHGTYVVGVKRFK